MDKSTEQTDIKFMYRAIAQAKLGLGQTSPNPPVGCVIISKSGELLAEGYHRRAGEAHAEIDALNKIKSVELLQGARMYVTLEPCSFEGRTPSCAKKIATLPLSEVVYGLIDPNPRVSGAGLKIIESSGIKTRKAAAHEADLNELIEHFLKNQIHKEAFVTLKIATSLDGCLGLKNGDSKWITEESSRALARELRGQHDAVLVGAGTIIRDNPHLDLRETKYSNKKLKLIVFDPRDQMKDTKNALNVFKSFSNEDILFYHSTDFRNFKKNMFGQGITSIFAEGGSFLHSQLLEQRIFDKLLLFMAPKLIGGQSGKLWTESLNISDLKDVIKFGNRRLDSIGNDFLFTMYPLEVKG